MNCFAPNKSLTANLSSLISERVSLFLIHNISVEHRGYLAEHQAKTVHEVGVRENAVRAGRASWIANYPN